MKVRKEIWLLQIIILLSSCVENGIDLKPIANFSYTQNQLINVTTIKFSNLSANATTFAWDFGDGSASTEKEPTHVFPKAGSYKVTLTATNIQAVDSIVQTITITDIVSLNNISIGYAIDNPTFIDVDGDGVKDFELSFFGTSGQKTESGGSSKILPANGYEIFADSIFTTISYAGRYPDYIETTVIKKIIIPRIYLMGDEIQNSDKTINTALNFCEYHTVYYNYSYRYNNWIKDEVRYVGFRKKISDKTRIGWIKLKVLDFTNVVLISFKIPSETESLLIDK